MARRINTPNRVLNLFGLGKDGWRGGNKALGINATENSADFMNMVQEEICQVAEAAGIALDPNNNAQLLQAINTFIRQGGAPGMVGFYAANAIPVGWLKANGALVSRVTYANLFSAIGTTYGVGDGATTFALPDFRGEFLRGFDDARGIDSGRVFGSLQLDAFQGHKHDMGISMSGAAGSAQQSPNAGGAAYSAVFGATTDGANGTPRVAAETRPRNVAVLACIKY